MPHKRLSNLTAVLGQVARYPKVVLWQTLPDLYICTTAPARKEDVWIPPSDHCASLAWVRTSDPDPGGGFGAETVPVFFQTVGLEVRSEVDCVFEGLLCAEILVHFPTLFLRAFETLGERRAEAIVSVLPHDGRAMEDLRKL